jgi:predicted permease
MPTLPESMRRLHWFEDLGRDLRYGLRSLRRAPVFAAVAIVTLALGIGANTAIFSILNSVILRPLGYAEPEQLVRLTARFPLAGSAGGAISYPEYEEFRAMARSFADAGVFAIGGTVGGGSGGWVGAVNLSAGERPLRARAALVDDHLLTTLGILPAQGRLFAPGETDAMAARPGLGGPPLAILSHELWQSAFGGRPLVGQTVPVDGRPHDVIGILPPGADVMDNGTEIWLPIGVHPVTRRIRDAHVLSLVARLKEGVTIDAAQAELDALTANWADRAAVKGHVPTNRPSRPQDHTFEMRPLQDAVVGDARRAIWVLQAAVGLVLLIACANLANLVMARAESRRREFAVRTAIGAGRGRLLRQTIAEGLLISAAGGALGVWLARTGVRALVLTYPDSLPRTSEVAVDLRVLLFALGVSIATGLFFGLAPLAQRRMRDVVAALKDEGGTGNRGAGRHHLRRALVTAEVALAVMLVVGAGLLLRTVYNLTRVDSGFDRSRMVTFSMTMPRGGSEAGGRAGAMQRLLDGLRTVPGVEAATAMSHLPLDRVVQAFNTGVENYANADGRPVTVVDYYQFVMSDYFETMNIPIVAGRAFEATDAAHEGVPEERVVIVNETLARRLWPGRDPLRQRLRPNLSASIGTGNNPWHTVIGVAKDVKEGGVAREAGAELYLFIDQPGPPIDGTERPWVPTAPPTMNVALRTSLPPSSLVQTLERAVREINPAIPIVGLREMDAVFAESIGRPRLLGQLLGVFAGLALLLAAVGTYGVLSFMAAERRREIGIRLALGATRASVLMQVLKQGLVLTVAGLAIGLAGALGLNRLVASLLFGVQPTDPATLAAVAVAMAAVAGFACWLPAWRASRMDPLAVLRPE